MLLLDQKGFKIAKKGIEFQSEINFIHAEFNSMYF